MVFDGERQPNTIYAASVSRGKDSTAMLLAIEELGWPLDAIYAVDIWATDDIPAELPPMVAFKDEWDRKCLERFGVPVTRVCAMKGAAKVTYESVFYKKVSPERERERERERESCAPATTTEGEDSYSTDSQKRSRLGATNSNACHSRIPDYARGLVQQRPQKRRTTYGFPMRVAPWCNSKLKGGILDNPTHSPRTRGRR